MQLFATAKVLAFGDADELRNCYRSLFRLVTASCFCFARIVMVCVLGRLFSVAAVCLVQPAAGHTHIDIRMENVPLPSAMGARRSHTSGAGFLAATGLSPGMSPESDGAEIDRETQAPLIWINLHKPTAASVDDASVQSYDAFAAQRLAQLTLPK